MPKVELHCHLLRHGAPRDLRGSGAARRRADCDGRDRVVLYPRRKTRRRAARAARARCAADLRSADDLQQHRLRVPGRRCHAPRRLQRVLLESDRHRARFRHCLPRGASRDRSRDPRCRAATRHHRPAGAGDRPRGPILAAALEMVGWVVEHRVDDVVGIGIDYREVDRPPELFAAAYAAARRAGLKTTAHAGEFGMPCGQTCRPRSTCSRSTASTTATRPSTSRRSRVRGDTLRRRRRHQVHRRPDQSAYYLRTLAPERWAMDHPIRRMAELGLRLHPKHRRRRTLHHVTPTGAWTMMARDFGFDLDQLRAFMLNGLDAAWIDDGIQTRAGAERRCAGSTACARAWSKRRAATIAEPPTRHSFGALPMSHRFLRTLLAGVITGSAAFSVAAQPAWPAARADHDRRAVQQRRWQRSMRRGAAGRVKSSASD